MAHLLLLYAATGAVVGMLAAALARVLAFLQAWWLGGVIGYLPPGPSGEGGLGQVFSNPTPWVGLLLVPAIFALASFLGSNRGLSRLILAFHSDERMPLTTQLRYIAGSLVELTAGSPLGREGPMAVLGDWVGRRATKWIGPAEEANLIFAGLAAGFASAFHAPLTGALLATEIFYKGFRLEAQGLTAALVGAFAGFAVSGAFLGYGPLIDLAPGSIGQIDILAALGLGLAGAAGASLLSSLTHAISGLRQRLTFWQRHLLLGLALSALATAAPEVLGDGLGWIEVSTAPVLATATLAVLLALRFLLQSLFVGLGGYGAPLTPTLVLGGLLGLIFARALPWPVDPEAMALAGMAALLASAVRTPLAAVALASELADYRVLPVVLPAVVLSYLLSKDTLLPEQRPS